MSDNKILVTLDGSARASRTIEYLKNFGPLRSKKLVLFSITTPVPEAFYDLKSGSFGREVSWVKAWEMGQQAAIEAFLDDARIGLVASGYPAQSVETLVRSRKEGIARDIIKESRQGYEALVVRRRGSDNSLLAVNLGGVAAKLVDKACDVPLIVAGVQKVSHNLCVATDGSEGSLRAVRFVANMVGQSPCRILLCAVVRDVVFKVPGGEAIPGMDDQILKSMETGLETARQTLLQAGVPGDAIDIKVIRHAKSRAGALVAAAGEYRCDTLVFGRKGRSMVENFDLGRIPRKVIYGSRKLTVWLVP